MKELEQLTRAFKRLDRTRVVEMERRLLTEVLSPLMGTVDVAEELGGSWTPAKVAVYNERGKLPLPIGYVGNRPMWTGRQIELFKLEHTAKEEGEHVKG